MAIIRSIAAPAIQPNYFAETADLDALVEGVRRRQSAGSNAYAALSAPAGRTPRCGRRRTCAPIFGAAPTPSSIVGVSDGRGPGTVVDGQLRVHGIEGLRIADASVMPVSVNSQTTAACLLIGDRAAQFML